MTADIIEVPFDPKRRANGQALDLPVWTTAADLQGREFEPVKYAVPGIFVEGLTLFAGKPKRGKSWLALNVAMAKAKGGYALGNIKCETGNVLALMLEDNERRLQDRLRQMEPSAKWPAEFAYATDWPRLDEGGLEKMEGWVKSVANPQMIIVDILQRVRAKSDSRKSPYADDYGALIGLQKFASVHRLAVIAIHHCRKQVSEEDVFDEISCTTGLTGAVDGAIVLRRGEGQADNLYGRGRDLPEIDKAVKFDQTRGLWTLLGDADDHRGIEVEKQIMNALNENGDPMSVTEIAKAVGGDYQSIKQRLYRMSSAGHIRKLERGKYGPL